jgi:hypothetical protein
VVVVVVLLPLSSPEPESAVVSGPEVELPELVVCSAPVLVLVEAFRPVPSVYVLDASPVDSGG